MAAMQDTGQGQARVKAGEDAAFEAQLRKKERVLHGYLRSLGSVAVAFSGGVDSTLLSKVAHDVLGSSAIAVTMKSAFVPEADLDEARRFCESEGIEHVVVTADVLAVPGVAANPPDRCYLCKRAVYTTINNVAREHGIAQVVDGGNVDDFKDYRPGHKAVQELGVVSPLAEAGMGKRDIRALSHELGLSTWDKPSAACLASRFPYGDTITQEGLSRVDAAERVLHGRGFENVRVRVHGDLARIEVEPRDIERLASPEVREPVARQLKEIGFDYVALDLQGYRMGSLNEVLGK